MKKEEAVKILVEGNEWRRGGKGEMPNPTEFGLAIDYAVNFMQEAKIDIEITKVNIECPNCGETCDVKVVDVEGAPFADYTHQCEHCEYWITESEWEEIKEEKQ